MSNKQVCYDRKLINIVSFTVFPHHFEGRPVVEFAQSLLKDVDVIHRENPQVVSVNLSTELNGTLTLYCEAYESDAEYTSRIQQEEKHVANLEAKEFEMLKRLQKKYPTVKFEQ